MRASIIDIQRVEFYTGTLEFITLAQAKQHLRVDFTDDDTYIQSMITRCRRRIENYCLISLAWQQITVTMEFDLGAAPYLRTYGTNLGVPYGTAYNAGQGPSIELPYGPIYSINSITSIAADNSVQILDPTQFDYYIRGKQFQRIEIENATWSNVIMMYNTGWNVDPISHIASPPDDLVLAILEELAFRYENRGDSTNKYKAQNVGLSEGAIELAGPYRRDSWL